VAAVSMSADSLIPTPAMPALGLLLGVVVLRVTTGLAPHSKMPGT